MTNRADAHVPNDTPTGDAASPPSPGAPTTTAPSSACAAMAHGECYGSLAAACAAITCPSEMCVATGDRPATVHCQH